MNDDMISRQAVRRGQFGNSEHPDCSDCVNHGGDWDCDHVHCRKGTDTISRQEAIKAADSIIERDTSGNNDVVKAMTAWKEYIKALPSAQSFHNITMNDVLKYIDGMPEDVWQEFTACLECRGWELQRRTAKWCGGEFA